MIEIIENKKLVCELENKEVFAYGGMYYAKTNNEQWQAYCFNTGNLVAFDSDTEVVVVEKARLLV